MRVTISVTRAATLIRQRRVELGMAANSMRKRSFVKDAQPANSGALLGYARVSKGDEQNNLLQAKALRAAGCRRVFEEVASGGRWDRPELHRMLDHLREGDTAYSIFVVWDWKAAFPTIRPSPRPDMAASETVLRAWSVAKASPSTPV